MYRFIVISLFLTGILFPVIADASQPKKIGRYSYWTVYKLKQNKNYVCYMSITAKPPKNKKHRGNVTLMITHRPSENVFDVVSYDVGARLKPDSNVKVLIGKKRFSLFTSGNTAWARDSETDRALTMAIRSGYFVTFMGYLHPKYKFADTVNLKGSAKAYELMSKSCGVHVSKVPVSARASYVKHKK